MKIAKIAEYKWLFVICFIALVPRLITVTILEYEPESDYATYQSMAINLLGGKGVIDNSGNYAMYNIGYPLFILTPIFAIFNQSIYAAQIANCFLGTISVALCYAVARQAGANKFGRLLAAAFWALYLPSWVYAEYLAKENLMIPLMLGVVYCCFRLAGQKSYSYAFVCGVLFGLLALTGNAALSLILPLMVSLYFMPAITKQKLTVLIVIILVSFLVAIPWVIRNHFVIDSYSLNTNGGFNLYLGNNPSATGMFISIVDTPLGSTWHELRRQRGEAKASETLKKEAIAWIKANPVIFIELAFKKAGLFWSPPSHDGKESASKIELIVRNIWLVQFILLRFTSILGIGFAQLRTKGSLLLWFSVIAYTGVHMIFYVIFRYREPIMPIMCVISALSIERILYYLNSHREFK